ncbi:hypothetical protein ACFL6S_25240 [Candidatus Poribacteria bacterium]
MEGLIILMGALLTIGLWGAAIAVVAFIVSTAIVVRKNTRQQTELQQEMKSLLWEVRTLLQKIADREEPNDVV